MSDEERVTVVREFPVELAQGDGRTIELRVVPYNTVARVADPPHFTPYDEMWMPGAFEKQLRAANRVEVFLNFEHEQGLRGIVGHGVALTDHADGLQGTFRVHENVDGEKALELVNEGLLTGVSLEAVPLRSVKQNGVVQRVRAHLDKVSLVRSGRPAYKDAQVLAVRTEPVLIEAVPAMSGELAARLEAIGVTPLGRIAVTKKPWDGSAARFTDEEYQASCLIDRGGAAPAKERCSLPVLEPDGALNVNALPVAAGRIYQLANATTAEKADAARKLLRYYRLAQMDPPPTIISLAQRGKTLPHKPVVRATQPVFQLAGVIGLLEKVIGVEPEQADKDLLEKALALLQQVQAKNKQEATA